MRIAIVATAGLGLVACSSAGGDPASAAPRTGEAPLVIELFTSQG